MLKILDWYILKRYLATFFVMLLLFIPIGITVHLAEKIGKMIEREAPIDEVLIYFVNFTIYFAHLLFPLFLFLSVIWFTSKLANNTEVIAFLSSGVSFSRFLRPYLIGATVVAILALILGMYLAPEASKGFNDFTYKYLKSANDLQQTRDVYRQINENDYIYVSDFDPRQNIGRNFTFEHFENDKMIYKISANSIKYKPEDSTYQLITYTKRKIGQFNDILETERRKDTLFSFDLEDLTPVEYIAETLPYGELNRFIAKEEARGSSYISRYKLVKYRKWSLPVSVFILTVIAVAVSSKKRRGGMGVNLAFGICIAMVFVFFDKIFGVMASQSDFPPLVAVWFPNVLFGILALYLLYNAKR
ncbi:LptF/LptG family permease [Mangrovimonas sp. AS39]|uniref:LptF/LptG family permease n=1 Tax=Mangrovimonas TaxID=1211036 RepID=UPI0009EA4EE4|nr:MULTISPECIES: LptF/LptG family permease [Mangrovimonas]MCF1191892.1 LptF/LptG family permease [Mangrovimonas futianensis]MCF1195587.1 LptF/LptG family permease [Mangrovimonas futianensis]MCF1422442.1 LptF/LptG family permease [Mangrovimonas futianensis]NIK92954.1 YjgP/YjgQ family permease [Mangrovimonas sp. CR14]